jgi:hypothetical protein
MSGGVAIYFGLLIALTLISLSPDAVSLGLLLFIVPGLVLIASGTLLYYSVALLPAYFINRFFRQRLLALAVAAISLTAAALLPHIIDGYSLGRLVAADHAEPLTSFRPQSFELPYPERANYWTNWRRPESRHNPSLPTCTDLCQQLLFRGNVDQVVVPDRAEPDPLANGTMVITKMRAFRINHDGTTQPLVPVASAPKAAEFFKPRWRRFRLERRAACPDTLTLIEGDFVREVIGGRCLVEDTVERSDADAALSIAEPPRDYHGGENDELKRIRTGPTTVTITERHDGRAVPVEVKSTLVARYAKAPFRFTAVRCGGELLVCVVVATDSFPPSFADPFAMIARRYGYAIAPTPFLTRLSVPVSDADRGAVEAILKADYGAGKLILMAQSQLVASYVNARLKSGELDPDDIELIRALLKQHAFTVAIDSNLPASAYQELKPLLPDMFERIVTRSGEDDGLVQALGAIVARFAAADTDPYSLALCRDAKNQDLQICRNRKFHHADHRRSVGAGQ